MTRPGARTRLYVGLAAVLTILIGVGSHGLTNIQRLVHTAAGLARTQETRASIRALSTQLTEAESSERGYLLTGDSAFLTTFRMARVAAESSLTALRNLTAESWSQQHRLQRITPLLHARLGRLDSAVAVPRAAPGTATTMRIGRVLMDSIQSELGRMERLEASRVRPRTQQTDRHARRTLIIVALGTGLAIVIAIIFGVLLQRDLAERMQREALYRSVVDVMADGVLVQYANGAVVDCNRSAERIFGRNREELMRLHETDLRAFREDGSDFPRDERPVRTALRTGRPVQNVVMGIERPDGSKRWLLMSTVPLAASAASRPIGVVTSFSDITRRREAEAALRESQQGLQDFLDNASDLILSTGVNGIILYANRAWRRALGYLDDADVLGRPIFDFLDPACLDQCRAVFERIMSGEAIDNVEATFVAKNGRRVEVSGNSNCRYENGRPAATRSIFRDVTEINAVHQELVKAIQHADAANQAKSEFLANMSHELRTPLNSVIGFAGVLQRNRAGTLGPQELQYLERIHDNGRHLLGLINSILDLSKIEAGRLDLDLSDVALDTLVPETLALMEPQVRDRPVVLAADVPAHLVPLATDATKLKQVIINLVGNALKFTEQGNVTVRVSADAHGRPTTIAVADTGIGIPEHRRQAIFEAFRQADNTTARKYGGSGLGLTITRALCNLMGYEVTVESTPSGSTFTVHLLTAHEAAADAHGADDATVGPATGRRVLIIDDDPDARLLLGQLLRDADCVPLAASGGERGLLMARVHRPDLIMLDIVMPHLNGLEVLEQLRTDPVLASIPVVIVSIVATEQRTRAVGAAALIDKPVRREEVEAVIQYFLTKPPADKRRQLTDIVRQRLSGPHARTDSAEDETAVAVAVAGAVGDAA